jgi:phosphatidylglycerol:prolipoprotein diacylglycerol transferase
MLVHPQFDPIAVQIGPLAVRWYGLMYVIGFVLFVVLGKRRARENLLTGWHPRDVDDMLFYGVFGVILGGRLGYVLFYKPLYYLAHPLEVVSVWQGGMSFHGGLLGVLVALWLFARSRRKRWLDVTDFVAPLVPLGLAAGSSAFINGELWGRVTDAWAMVFRRRVPSAASSQLYGVRPRGLILFAVLWITARRRRRERRRACFSSATGSADSRGRAGADASVSCARPHDGPVAIAADDRDRRRDAAPRLPARGQARADRAGPDEIARGRT